VGAAVLGRFDDVPHASASVPGPLVRATAAGRGALGRFDLLRPAAHLGRRIRSISIQKYLLRTHGI